MSATESTEAPKREWVMRVVVISNVHLPEKVFNDLRDSWDEDHSELVNFFDGILLYTGEDIDNIDDRYPDELVTCVQWAIDQGYPYLRFDPDGEVIPELTDYGW